MIGLFKLSPSLVGWFFCCSWISAFSILLWSCCACRISLSHPSLRCQTSHWHVYKKSAKGCCSSFLLTFCFCSSLSVAPAAFRSPPCRLLSMDALSIVAAARGLTWWLRLAHFVLFFGVCAPTAVQCYWRLPALFACACSASCMSFYLLQDPNNTMEEQDRQSLAFLSCFPAWSLGFSAGRGYLRFQFFYRAVAPAGFLCRIPRWGVKLRTVHVYKKSAKSCCFKFLTNILLLFFPLCCACCLPFLSLQATFYGRAVHSGRCAWADMVDEACSFCFFSHSLCPNCCTMLPLTTSWCTMLPLTTSCICFRGSKDSSPQNEVTFRPLFFLLAFSFVFVTGCFGSSWTLHLDYAGPCWGHLSLQFLWFCSDRHAHHTPAHTHTRTRFYFLLTCVSVSGFCRARTSTSIGLKTLPSWYIYFASAFGFKCSLFSFIFHHVANHMVFQQ